MNTYNYELHTFDENLKELAKHGISLPDFKDMHKGEDFEIIYFLYKQYDLAFEKSFASIEFLKNTKLIKKNPAPNEHFTYKKDIDILKIMNSKTSQNQALMLNFINSFTKSLEDENLQFIFSTQTIATQYRHKYGTNMKKNILLQKDALNSFHRKENKHFQFFKKNSKIDTSTGKRSSKREFIRALEFH